MPEQNKTNRMEEWGSQIIAKLDDKLKDAKERDLRFFRISEFKRNINRIDSFSNNCPYCKKQKIYVAEIADKIDEAVDVPGKSRREYDRLIGQMASHMQKAHGFYTPFYFSYLFSFFGMVAGLLLGYLMMKLFPAYNWEMLSLGFILGLATGYFWGGMKDRKIRSEKRLM